MVCRLWTWILLPLDHGPRRPRLWALSSDHGRRGHTTLGLGSWVSGLFPLTHQTQFPHLTLHPSLTLSADPASTSVQRRASRASSGHERGMREGGQLCSGGLEHCGPLVRRRRHRRRHRADGEVGVRRFGRQQRLHERGRDGAASRVAVSRARGGERGLEARAGQRVPADELGPEVVAVEEHPPVDDVLLPNVVHSRREEARVAAPTAVARADAAALERARADESVLGAERRRARRHLRLHRLVPRDRVAARRPDLGVRRRLGRTREEAHPPAVEVPAHRRHSLQVAALGHEDVESRLRHRLLGVKGDDEPLGRARARLNDLFRRARTADRHERERDRALGRRISVHKRL
mmetsp:Transcript_35605/g.61056  ORF Transcript_35605/g.61056 Transcript_35605/m.61056 type:complete len:350 (-) Transcript_35605:109-1158(-)